MSSRPDERSAADGPDVGNPQADVCVRLLGPGEGASALAIATGAGAPGADEGGDLQAAIDQSGGRIEIPELPGGTGWCFGATLRDRLVGVVYACSPVAFILTHGQQQRHYLTRSLVEIEILAVEASSRGRGVGATLLARAEQHLREHGVRLFVAKVDATDMAILRWYRHRGYTIARSGETCTIDTPAGTTGIDAGGVRDTQWRLAVKAPEHTATPSMSGFRLTPPLTAT
ncbi:GNAT family N-acetyltransferase [Amycolatopsis sp. PS_44_ISF1]|uniref:GNAT family N-acetyltransferase n=1 Tax=Amycolatopsis sp. PS_44_ISF1 TaxID=2974917 RepID=UPI0028DE0905|nr:GNAT family N-acetyltransferase [Amycolatopsis sp. PS_44_ISF1]MDT8913536.1 GNAT family N-acetyltransferase [Amycolatopsis sp. PS_44_ISF1]